MTVTLEILGVVALVNVLAGAVLALLVLKSQETIPQIAPVPGIAFGGIGMWAQLTVGKQLSPTMAELETLVLTAAVAALIGIIGVFSTLQAEPTDN